MPDSRCKLISKSKQGNQDRSRKWIDYAQWAYTFDTVELWGKCISVNHREISENWSSPWIGKETAKTKRGEERYDGALDPACDPGFDGERDREGNDDRT